MPRQITLRDIGKELGLSAMTVSLALRDSPRISDATKKRVRAATRGRNLEPNQLARALATGRSNLIGVIVPNSSDLYYAEVIRAIEDAASALQYHVLLCNGSYRMETYTARVRDMRRLHMKGIVAARTRFFVASEMRGLSRRASDTVIADSPSSRPMSRSVIWRDTLRPLSRDYL